MELNENDLKTIEKRGITPERLEEELEMLRDGFPYLRIEAPATVGNGISAVTPVLAETSAKLWDDFLKGGGTVTKMVPASGAASRMFKDLFAFLNGKKDRPDTDFVKKFFAEIKDFAFFAALNATCMKLYGKAVEALISENRYKDVVAALLNREGLNYGQLPKALLEFHKTLGGARTPLEEHLAEGAQYAAEKKGNVRIHFTVSTDHVPLFDAKIREVADIMATSYGVKYDITTSIQKPSTDTVAANLDGTPCRVDGELFFRPGGHGALIENLNDLRTDVVFIKNIDNVVPDERRDSTIRHKKILGGILVGLASRRDEYCRRLKKGVPSDEKLAEMLDFLRKVFCVTHDKADEMTPVEKANYLMEKLNRPIRVCGMVKNEGEPGGGPFLVYSADGTVAPQILESTQIDPNDKEAQKMLKSATHFNPVDLVVSTRDFEGKFYNLPDFIDKTTGFISSKSVGGKEIKALELPGLWNGAMSDWNTILVEVPSDTFNPVKTVNDLLRPAHQPAEK